MNTEDAVSVLDTEARGALTERPPMEHISTQTKCPLDISSTVTVRTHETSHPWQYDTCLQRPGILRPPPSQGGRIVTCDIMSTVFYLVCEILALSGIFPFLTLYMVSQTEQKSTNPWISVLCALT